MGLITKEMLDGAAYRRSRSRRGLIKFGLNEARNLYDQGPNPYQQQGNEMVAARATGGDPTITAAQNYVQTSLNGGFLNSNPYLDKTFEQARLATQGGLSSEFARSGRNVGASEGLRSQQLDNLATSIYGGAYNNDRALQQASLGYAQPLGNQAYTDAAQLRGLQNPQGTALDEYLARINGTQLPPRQGGFSATGALGGALTGFASGGPLGAVGGLLGGLF